MASPSDTSPRSTKIASPGGTLTIAANTLLLTSQVILCLGSPAAHDPTPAPTSPHVSSFHNTLTSLHTFVHRDFTNQHTGPHHSVTNQKTERHGPGLSWNGDRTEVTPAGEVLRRSTWDALTESHPNKFLSTGLSRFSQALNPTSPLNLQPPRLGKSTWKSGEKSLMNMDEIEGVSARQGEGNDEDLSRKSKDFEFVHHKNDSRSVPIKRPPHGLDSSSTDSFEVQMTAVRNRNSFKAWEQSSKENCFFTPTKDEVLEEITVNAAEKVTDSATIATGEANVRNYEELRRLMPAPEDGERLASIEGLSTSRSRGELSPLPSLTRFSGPVTRSQGKRPAFLRVSEMMVNSMRSLEQEYPSEENIIEQENPREENLMEHDDPSEERKLEEKDTSMTRYTRSGIRKLKNEVDPKINEDFHLEQELTSEEHHLKQEHPSQEHHLEHKHTSKVRNIQQIINKEHHLQKVRASGVPTLEAVMATSDVASGGHKTTTGFSSPVLNYHTEVKVTTTHHQLHPARINDGSDNSVLNESSTSDTHTPHKTVSKWRKTSFAKRRTKTPLTKSDEKFLGTTLTSSPNNVTTKLFRGNYIGFLETNDNVIKTRAPPTTCSSSAGGCSNEESTRTGSRELTQLVTAPQPLEPETGREAPQHEDDDERLPPFPEKYDLHYTSKVKDRLQFQGHAHYEKDQEQVILESRQETLAEDKTGEGYTARRTEGRDEGSEAHRQKILVSSLDTKRRYLRTSTSGLDKPSPTKEEDNIEGLSPANKRQQSGEKNERRRTQAGGSLDLHDTNHLKDPHKRRIKRNAAMVTDGMANDALVPDEGSGALALNITKYLPGRYHSLLQIRSREIFRGLGTESRSGNAAGETRQDGSAGVAGVMNSSRASPEDTPKASMNSSQDLHIPGDFGVLRETHQGILSSLGPQPDKNTNETPQVIPPGVSNGPDYSYLPPGFSGIDNGRGCNCWQTHDDSFMKEIECRCQGEHVVQLPANLSTNVDRLTLTKTSVESLGHQNLSQYKSALQELILRDAKELRKMETDCFREMKRLRTIYISHAPRLVALPPHIFHAFLPSLKVLRIVYTGLAELPSLTQLATNSIIHMVDLENNKIRRIRGSSVNIRTEQLLLDNNMLDTIEARAFHGSQIGKLSMKGNLRLTNLHPLAFKGLKSLISLDLSETGISHLPTVGLEGLETLRLVRTYNLKVFPSVYSFKSITTAELTYHYHCCAFKFPKLHDPAEHKKHEEFLRRMEKEQCSEVTSTSSVTSPSQVGLGRRRRRVALEPHPSPQPPVDLEPHSSEFHYPHQPKAPRKPHLAGSSPSPRRAAVRRGKTANIAEGGVRSSVFPLPSNTEENFMHSSPPPLLRSRHFPSVSTMPPPSTSLTPSSSTSPSSPPSTLPTPPPSTSSPPPSRITTPEGPDVSSQDLFVFSRAYKAKKFLGEEKVVIIGTEGPAPRPRDQPRQYYLQGRQHHQAEKNRLNSEGIAEGRGDGGTPGTGSRRPPLTECQNGRCMMDHNPGLQQQTSDGELFISRTTTEPMPGTFDDFSDHGDENSRTGGDRPAGPVRLQMGLNVFINVHRGGSGGRGTSSNVDGGADNVGWVNSNSGGVPLSHWALGAGDTRYPTVRDRVHRVASTKIPAPVEDPSEAEHIISGFSEHEGGFSNLGFSEMDNFGFPEHHGFDMDEGLGTHLSSYPGGGVGVEGFSLDDDHGFPDDYDPDECVNGLCPKTARLPPHGPAYPLDPNNHFDSSYPFEPVEVFHSSDAFRPVADTSVEGTTGDHSGSPHGKFHNKVSLSQGIRTVCRGNLSKNYRDVQCVPEPDAFNPCEDIMGNLGLRVAVWLVVVTAVFGNLAVMVVLMSTRFKMTVSKFLMCNLAGADLCMGLYLLIIAAMDLRTIGVYFNYAIDWQNGPGCKVAGFLTVFASELSILTLAVITLERWYAITYAIHLNKRLRLSVAVRVMVLAWLYALTMATLPLLGVSGYSKTSICLPMETVDGGDQVYLLILLITNGLAFILICVCYAKMYCSIAGNNLAANTSDTTVAKRMALLVFTDFACWAPIAFFGLTAVSGYPLISVTHAKFLLVFFYPLNSCANPYLYAILTKQYRRDLFILLARHGFCTKRAMKYKGGYSTNTWLNHHNVCVSGGTGGGSGGPSRRISTLTQITTCGDWRSRVRDGSEESLGRQCSPSRARSISAELTVPNPMTMGLADRRLSDVGRRLQPVAEVRDGRASPKPASLAPTSGSPHPIKNCYARMSFTPEQEALLLRYASDRQPSVTPANARRRTSPSDRDEAVPLSIYTPTTPDTITTPISPQLDHSV